MKRNSFFAFVLAIVMLLSFVGCSASTNDGAMQEMAYDTMTYAVSKPQGTLTAKGEAKELANADTVDGSSLYTPIDDRKLIKNANLEMETLTYEESVEALKKTVTDFGGYIENSSMGGSAEYYSRYYEITVRIPAEKFDEFLSAQDSVATVNHTYVWTEDVTDQYIDNETRIETLKTKKDRLLTLLEQATEMKDIIELESALSDTIYELEKLTGNQNKLIARISFSTINISMWERSEPSDSRTTPITLGERIAHQFENSWRSVKNFFSNTVVFIAGNSPMLVLLLVIAVIIFFIVRICTKRSTAKRMKRLETYKQFKAQQAAQAAKQESEEKTE